MKSKLSLTLDKALVAFIDSEPGESRSEKLESILRRCRDAQRDATLRRELAAFKPSPADESESAAWRQVRFRKTTS